MVSVLLGSLITLLPIARVNTMAMKIPPTGRKSSSAVATGDRTACIVRLSSME